MKDRDCFLKKKVAKMCEFCTEHGEGKKWYLQMKNYAEGVAPRGAFSPPKRPSSALATRFRMVTICFWDGLCHAGRRRCDFEPPEAVTGCTVSGRAS